MNGLNTVIVHVVGMLMVWSYWGYVLTHSSSRRNQ